MRVTLRHMAAAVLVVGVGFGVAFGAGVAYGSPKQVQGGLTQQQLVALLGVGTGGLGAGASGAGGASGAAGAAAGLAALGTAGRVVSVQGDVVTIETRQGNVRVNLSSSTTLTKVASATRTDLKEGMTVLVGGQRGNDGTIAATSVTELPQQLAGILTGGGTQQGR